MRKFVQQSCCGIAISMALALPATAQNANQGQSQGAQMLSKELNQSWISVTGIVASTTDSAFRLDYGPGLITVEMDDWDWYKEGRSLLHGDRVTVVGRVDNDFYQKTPTLEASSVYVEDLNTYFYASNADEEGVVLSTPWFTTHMNFMGTVTTVDGREFTLNTGTGQMKVDTSQMPYNPLDGEGYQRIKKGDRVMVSGDLDYDVVEKKEIMADRIITLSKDNSKRST